MSSQLQAQQPSLGADSAVFSSVFSGPSGGSVGGRAIWGGCVSRPEGTTGQSVQACRQGPSGAQGETRRSPEVGVPSTGPPQVFAMSVHVVAGPEGMEVQGRPERWVE